jgi:tetratricopeptide (TPR) repeat protein
VAAFLSRACQRAVFLLAIPLAFCQPSDPVAQGIAAFHQGRYAEARTILEKAPASEHSRVFLALSRAALGDCAAVSADLGSQFDQAGDPALRRLAGLALVQCYIAQSRYPDAFPVAARLASLYPKDADVLYQSARLYMKAWNDTLYQMFRNTPASFRVNQISAEIFETQNHYAEAIAEYRKAIEKNPSALDLHFHLGRALLMQSHSPEALDAAQKEFEAELALNPSDAVAEHQIGLILLARQKPEQAVARFERALALNPDFPEALQALAKSRMDAKQYDAAIALLVRLIRLQPANEGAHYSLMMAYRNTGKSDEALREKAELEKLSRPPEGEFTEFLKRLGEKAPDQ